MTNFLENLKRGDKVAIRSRYGYSITKVMNVTKTQIVTERSKYRMKDGTTIGGSIWDCERIEQLTPEIEVEIKREYLVRKIQKQRFEELSLQKLEKIYEIIKQGEL